MSYFLHVDNNANVLLEDRSQRDKWVVQSIQNATNKALTNANNHTNRKHNEVWNRTLREVKNPLEARLSATEKSLTNRVEALEQWRNSITQCPPMEAKTDVPGDNEGNFWGANADECRKYCSSKYFVYANNRCYCKNSKAYGNRVARDGHIFGQTCLV